MDNYRDMVNIVLEGLKKSERYDRLVILFLLFFLNYFYIIK